MIHYTKRSMLPVAVFLKPHEQNTQEHSLALEFITNVPKFNGVAVVHLIERVVH